MMIVLRVILDHFNWSTHYEVSPRCKGQLALNKASWQMLKEQGFDMTVTFLKFQLWTCHT